MILTKCGDIVTLLTSLAERLNGDEVAPGPLEWHCAEPTGIVL